MPNALQTIHVIANDAHRESDALYAAAVVRWRESRRDDAIKLMDEALRLKPDFADALCMGAYMLSECGRPESAMRFYRRALQLDASLGIGHINFGKLLFAAGRFTEGQLRNGDETRAGRSGRVVQPRGSAARAGAT